MANLNSWWSSITISEKERIAFKITGKDMYYPACTEVWNSLEEGVKQKIYDHCTHAHGLTLEDWKDGTPYGD